MYILIKFNFQMLAQIHLKHHNQVKDHQVVEVLIMQMWMIEIMMIPNRKTLVL